VSDDDISVLRAAADELAGWQEEARRQEIVVCHGDVHPQNVLMRGDELVIIDWDNICMGPAAWDHAALLTWAERWGGAPGDYEAFAAAYGAELRDSPLAQTLARMRLLAPTINKIIVGGESDRHAAEALVRMRYWRASRRRHPGPPSEVIDPLAALDCVTPPSSHGSSTSTSAERPMGPGSAAQRVAHLRPLADVPG
jgi:Ser/Thr protein kinase RdoA (MazF antagonist)